MLGSNIGGHASHPGQPGAGRSVDDRAAAVLLEQLGDLSLHTEEHASEIDRDNPRPVLFAALMGIAALPFDASIVESAIEPPISLDCLCNHRFTSFHLATS